MNSAVANFQKAQAGADLARIRAMPRRYCEQDFDVDPSLADLAVRACRASRSDCGIVGAVKRLLRAGTQPSIQQLTEVLNALRGDFPNLTNGHGGKPCSSAPGQRRATSQNPVKDAANGCVHRYRLEEASEGRRTVKGLCAYCGASRQFRVSLPWYGELDHMKEEA